MKRKTILPINDVDDFAARDSASVIRRMLDPRIGGPTVMGVDIAVKFEGEVPQQLLQQADVLMESEPPRAQR